MDKQTESSRLKNFSLIMTLYKADSSEFLKEALEPVLAQTVMPEEMVIICDGPVGEDLLKVCNNFKKEASFLVKIIKLAKNVGHGAALNEALKHTSNDLVAKMDADDVMIKDRFELQLEEFKTNPKIAICSGHAAEFSGSIKEIDSYRKVPISHQDILKYVKTRSPFNHPAVMYKKSAVQAVGGYPEDVYRAEDYYLWVKLLSNGYEGVNIDSVLFYFRASKKSFNRKKSWENVKTGISSRWFAYRHGLANLFDFLKASAGYLILFISPTFLTKRFYEVVLRKNSL